MNSGLLAGLLAGLLLSGCAGIHRTRTPTPLPEPLPVTTAENGAASVPQAVATAPVPAAPEAPPPVVPAGKNVPAPAKTVAPAPVVAVPKAPAPATAPPKSAGPSLDLAALETRLRETRAIGMLTKLSLKNQVDDLVGKFRAYYKGQAKTSLAELRPSYDRLLLKVLSLLQDADPPLARDIVASREALWGILADAERFSEARLMAGETS